jgi:hypothetical protein
VKRAALPLLALAAYASLLALSAPAWPDDWDGIGFFESVTDFDLAAFRPHPPGYPVYVALLRLAATVTRHAWSACVLVAAASGAMTLGFAWVSLRRLQGNRAAWLGAALVGLLPMVWRAFSGVGSEAPALACASACAWGLSGLPVSGSARAWSKPALLLGIGAGLGLGIRLSWAPLFVALLAVAQGRVRWRASAIAATVCVGWVVPLVAVVGAGRLAALYATHFAGHSARWGGTALTEPGLVRFSWLARDVLADGFGTGTDILGLAVGALLALASVIALAEWRRAGWRGLGLGIAVMAPYTLWVLLGQNLRDQSRHVLPLVAALACGLAVGAMRSAPGRAALVALGVLAAVRTGEDASARRSIPPPGQQLVELARAQPPAERPAVFGVASVRFFETTEMSSRAFVANSLGDVEMALTRIDRLPRRVWVTSEVAGLPPGAGNPWAASHVATLCRPPRLDRRSPCIDVVDWRPPYLPR